jgi:hypothetical protein
VRTCPACTRDPDPRGPSACADCRALNEANARVEAGGAAFKQMLRTLEGTRPDLPAELRPRDEIFEEGYWHPCSGCHESDEGHPRGPYSAALRCHLGAGCHECGGIGAIWEQFDPDLSSEERTESRGS